MDSKIVGLIAIAIGLVLVMVTIGICIEALFLLWGARIAAVKQRTFRRAFLIALLGGAAATMAAAVVQMLPFCPTTLAVIVGFLVTALVTMAIFRTTFGRAVTACLLAIVLKAAILGAVALAGLAIGLSLGGLGPIVERARTTLSDVFHPNGVLPTEVQPGETTAKLDESPAPAPTRSTTADRAVSHKSATASKSRPRQGLASR